MSMGCRVLLSIGQCILKGVGIEEENGKIRESLGEEDSCQKENSQKEVIF